MPQGEVLQLEDETNTWSGISVVSVWFKTALLLVSTKEVVEYGYRLFGKKLT